MTPTNKFKYLKFLMLVNLFFAAWDLFGAAMGFMANISTDKLLMACFLHSACAYMCGLGMDAVAETHDLDTDGNPPEKDEDDQKS